ncbi:MAG: hypothetical protein ACYTF7_05940 [Planctomycetota bacterium]|jgi:hypothetical protein
MESELLSLAAQFGAAGLIAWMWLTERRSSSARETQLSEAHDQLREQRVQMQELLRIVTENTRALSALDASNTRIAEAIERLTRVERSRDGSAIS